MKATLALLALGLALLLVWQWRDWPPPPPAPRPEGPVRGTNAPPSPPEKNPLELLTPLGEKEEYGSVTERPLFREDRRPPSEEPEQEAPAEQGPPSDLARLDLSAVLITPAESSAWIRDPTKKDLVRLRPGEELEGWSVQEILSDRVLLERQGEKDTLVLRDYKNMPPPIIKPPARSSRQPQPRTADKRSPAPDGHRPNPNRLGRDQRATPAPQAQQAPRAREAARASLQRRQPSQQRELRE